jgi:hypothetical protein
MDLLSERVADSVSCFEEPDHVIGKRGAGDQHELGLLECRLCLVQEGVANPTGSGNLKDRNST